MKNYKRNNLKIFELVSKFGKRAHKSFKCQIWKESTQRF